MDRRKFIRNTACGTLGLMLGGLDVLNSLAAAGQRPNILFAIADDWAWPFASIVDEPGIETPAFDRVARNGVLFTNAFTAAPQCSPCRAATLTGRNIWEIQEAGTHFSLFPAGLQAYPDLLETAGYHVGYTGKGWAPGEWEKAGRPRNPAGNQYNQSIRGNVPAMGITPIDYAGNFELFLKDRPDDTPFCFWFGGYEPHRDYEYLSGRNKNGKDPSVVRVPGFLPDVQETRDDLADYFVEVEWFDTHLGRMLKKLHKMGELENTLVVVTGDNGMPFPRAKATLYDYGVHVPLAIMWPKAIPGGRVVDNLTTFIDFAPTFCEAAGVPVPPNMTGRSLLDMLQNPDAVDDREYILYGRERHACARRGNIGYPGRAIRTKDFLYIRNLKPDRWPAGDPESYGDIDASPSKTYMMENREAGGDLFDKAFGKRPAEELFKVSEDPYCLNDLAQDAAYADVKQKLKTLLETGLKEQGDPAMTGGPDFDDYPYFGTCLTDLTE